MRSEVRASSSTPERRRRTIGALLLTASLTGGCGARGAPWFSLFGAYFPAWLLCALVGVIGAVLARALLVAIGLDAIVRARLLTYGSLGVILALGTKQCGFGP
jgi:hypothetical protein